MFTEYTREELELAGFGIESEGSREFKEIEPIVTTEDKTEIELNLDEESLW